MPETTTAPAEKKELTPEIVLTRITGCGMTEAKLRIPRMDGAALVTAYLAKDRDGLNAVLMKETPPAPKPKKAKKAPAAPPKE